MIEKEGGQLVRGFLEELYPGAEPVVDNLRQRLLEVAYSPGLTTVILEGPPGSGKTTMARALAMARMLARISPSFHRKHVLTAGKEVRTGSPPMRWYRDISLAGLSDTLAEMQLFGVGEKVATGVSAHVGVFEQAMTGCIDSKDHLLSHYKLTEKAKSGEVNPIPHMIGGVVLLDEIGDLQTTLQAKLLRVLNGETQYRVGKEGNSAFGFNFRGLVILATWKDVFASRIIRDDLLQRITQFHIKVPSLSEFSTEALQKIIKNTFLELQQSYENELAETTFIDDTSNKGSLDPKFDLGWTQLLMARSKFTINEQDLSLLSKIDWSEHGQFRGLRATIRQIMGGTSVDKVLLTMSAKANFFNGSITAPINPSQMLQQAEQFVMKEKNLSQTWKSARCQWAKEMLGLLNKRSPQLLSLLERQEKDLTKFRKELINLTRSN